MAISKISQSLFDMGQRLLKEGRMKTCPFCGKYPKLYEYTDRFRWYCGTSNCPIRSIHMSTRDWDKRAEE